MIQTLLNSFINGDANISNIAQPVDLSKKENLDNFISQINSIRASYKDITDGLFSNIIPLLVGKDFDIDTVCDEIIESAQTKHNELVENVERPSSSVSDKILNNISNLATEYVDTMIKPHAKLTDEQRKSIYECLTEFGCWIYNHK